MKTTARITLVLIASVLLVQPLGTQGVAAQELVGPSPSKFCVYVKLPLSWWETGHAFLQVIPKATAGQPRKLDRVYGLAPDGWKLFGAQGRVRDDSLQRWEWKICWEITDAEHDTAVGRIKSDLDTPPTYNLLSNNCVDWTKSVTLEIGKTPPNSNRFLGVDTPRKLAETLEAAGNGNMLNGGTVTRNPAPGVVGPSSGIDPPSVVWPDQCDYDGYEEFGFASSATLAAATHLEPHLEVVDPVTVGVNQDLTVTISNVDTDEAVTMIEWDDGTGRARQNDSATHAYAATGQFQVRTLVIDNGAVNEFVLPVEVLPSGGGASRTVTVPDTPDNLPYVPPPDAPCPETIDPPHQCAVEAAATSDAGLLVIALAMVMVIGVTLRRGAPPRHNSAGNEWIAHTTEGE